MENVQLVSPCLEECVIVEMPMGGVKKEDGQSDVIIMDVLPNRNTMRVLESKTSVRWVMEHGVMITKGRLNALL